MDTKRASSFEAISMCRIYGTVVVVVVFNKFEVVPYSNTVLLGDVHFFFSLFQKNRNLQPISMMIIPMRQIIILEKYAVLSYNFQARNVYCNMNSPSYRMFYWLSTDSFPVRANRRRLGNFPSENGGKFGGELGSKVEVQYCNSVSPWDLHVDFVFA